MKRRLSRNLSRLGLFGVSVFDAPLSDDESLVRRWTKITRPELCPQIALHLASEITELWEETERHTKTTALPPPFWAFCWPGGQGLARFILDHPDLFAGRHVLDFASGSGVAAIAAMLVHARQTVAVEIDPLAAIAIGLNASLNDCEIEIWLEDLTKTPLQQIHDYGIEIVLAGDVFYEKRMSERVLPFLQTLADSGLTVLLGDPGRAYLPQDRLIKQGYYQPLTNFALESPDRREVVIWKLPSCADKNQLVLGL